MCVTAASEFPWPWVLSSDLGADALAEGGADAGVIRGRYSDGWIIDGRVPVAVVVVVAGGEDHESVRLRVGVVDGVQHRLRSGATLKPPKRDHCLDVCATSDAAAFEVFHLT